MDETTSTGSAEGFIDEYCDLTFDELVDELGKDENDITISRNPKI